MNVLQPSLGKQPLPITALTSVQRWGPHFSGNVNDPNNKRQYVACWRGVTAGCIACPGTLEFNRRWNACLFKGQFKQVPRGRDALDYVFSFIRK